MKIIIYLILFAFYYIANAQVSWTNRFDGNGNAYSKSITKDQSGNVYICGKSTNNGNGAGYLTIKYTNSGLPVWTNYFIGLGISDKCAIAIAVDTSSNSYVTGYTTSTNGDYDYATIKYSASGMPQWTNFYNGVGNGNDQPIGIAIDSSFSVIVAGNSIDANGHNKCVIIKYTSSGSPVWTNVSNQYINNNDYATALTADKDGNTILVGYTESDYRAAYSFLIIKYTSEGVALWTNTYLNPSGFFPNYNLANAVSVDGNGFIYVTGESADAFGVYDITTIKYSNMGSMLWVNTYKCGTMSFGYAVCLAYNGNVYITGSSATGAIFPFQYQFVTLAYSSSGVSLWTNIFNGTDGGDSQSAFIATDSLSNVYITGESANGAGNHDYVTIKYFANGDLASINRYNGTGNAEDVPCGIVLDANNNVFVTGTSANSNGNLGVATIKYNSTSGLITNGLVFTNIMIKSGIFSFQINGQAGSNVVIKSSNDLKTWDPVFTNNIFNGSFQFNDTNASKYFFKYYKAQYGN